MSILPNHNEICDLAKLTMLVYEYGKNFTIDKNKNLQSFIEDMCNSKIKLSNDLRLNVIKELSASSPLGRVHKFFSIESTDLQVGITISEVNKRITIVFRGSESKYDWYYDLSILKKKLHDDVYVHSGFYNQLHNEDMYKNLKKELDFLLLQYSEYKIFVTGHSLGAGLATLFGYELSKDVSNNITVVSFASPRVGNAEFRKYFDKKKNLVHYRITNDRDIVTAAPMINFQHVGINISLTDEKLEVFDKYSYNSWFKFSLFTCWSVSDHNIDLYYKRILKHKW